MLSRRPDRVQQPQRTDGLPRPQRHRRGRKARFSHTVTVPDQFDLCVRKREQSFQARIAWRRDDEIGVALLPQRPSTAIPLDIARRFRDCEAENLALKRRLALLTEM